MAVTPQRDPGYPQTSARLVSTSLLTYPVHSGNLVGSAFRFRGSERHFVSATIRSENDSLWDCRIWSACRQATHAWLSAFVYLHRHSASTSRSGEGQGFGSGIRHS